MDFEPLFTPFTIGKVTLRNRFVMSPMQKHKPANFVPGPEMANYYKDRIQGGIGLIVTQGTTMDHPTTMSPYARLYPPAYDGWRACADVVRKNGGEIVMQLWHEGNSREGGFGPSGLNALGKETGHALTRQQIPEIVEMYAEAARTAEKLGFTGIEMHYSQAYLLGLFLRETSNRRDDEYGGDFAARMRIGVEVARAIRAAVGPDFIVGMRTGGYRHDGSERAFPTLDDLKSFLTQMRDIGVDYFNTSTGRFFTAEYPELDKEMSYPGWIKALVGVPAMGGGCVGMSDVLTTTLAGKTVQREDNFAELLRRFHRGDFDLITLGRTIYTDAQWPTKLREHRFVDMLPEITSAHMQKEEVIAR
jgi:2,4-dienoyl-CoA reductase-like NADH-dependent reductase (Old Yellow Enzyme family)